jgi:serine protease
MEPTDGDPSIVVAVVDTGIHSIPTSPDACFRLRLHQRPGRARDGSGRDADPRDEGDWTADGECFAGSFGEPSSWHGTFVAA